MTTDLDEWRSRRTGRAVKTADVMPDVASNSNGAPDAPRSGRHPLEGFTPAQDDDFQNDASANYKATPGEAEALREQLAAAQGRLAPTQRQLEEMRSAVAAAQQQNAELSARLAAKDREEADAASRQAAASFNPFEGLPKEQLELMDPEALKLLEHVGRSAYAKATGGFKDPEALIQKVLSQRDARDRDAFISATAETLGLSQKSNDAKFNKFLADDDSAGLLLNSFVQSSDIATARMLEPRVRNMIKRYEKAVGSYRAPDPQDRAAAYLSRKPDGQSAEDFRGGSLPADEVKRITEQARRLSRAGKHKDAAKMLEAISN